MWSVLPRLWIVAFVAIAVVASAANAAGATRITPAEAAARAQERFLGDVLDVELDDPDDDEPAREVYEVKLLTRDNMIIKVKIDAATGTFLEAKGDNLIPAIRRPGAPR